MSSIHYITIVMKKKLVPDTSRAQLVRLIYQAPNVACCLSRGLPLGRGLDRPHFVGLKHR